MNRLSLILILLLANTISSKAQEWQCLYDGLIQGNSRIDDVSLINDSTGYYVTSIGYVVKFENYGDKQSVINPSKKFSYCRSVEFFNDKCGFVGTLNEQSPLYVTYDGGVTWTNLKSKLGASVTGVCGLDIIGDSTIYGVGKFSMAKYFIKSNDLGQTWQVIDMSAYATGLIDVEFISKDTGFVSGYHKIDSLGGIVLYTTDGGITWSQKITTNFKGQSIWKLQNLDGKNWFGSIESHPNQEIAMIKSIDSGQTWTYHLVDTAFEYIQVIAFINKNRGWTGGMKQQLYETNDGGQTWAIIPSCNRNFDRFHRVNDSLAYMTGKSFMRYSTRPLVTGIENKYLNEPFHQLSIKPNPVAIGEKLSIELNQSSDTYAEIGVVDIQGKFIEVIQRKIQTKGKYSYKIKIDEKYSSGIYTLYLYTNEGMESLNFIVR